MDTFAISLFSLQPFSTDDVFLPVDLDHFANLLTFVMSSDNLNLIILSSRHRTLYFCLNSLESEEDILFLWIWEGALICYLWFLLRWTVTKELNFILVAAILPQYFLKLGSITIKPLWCKVPSLRSNTLKLSVDMHEEIMREIMETILCVRNSKCSALPFHQHSGQDFVQGRARVHHESRLFSKSMVLGCNSTWVWPKTSEFHLIWKLPCFPNFFQSFLEKVRTEKSHLLAQRSFGGSRVCFPGS